MEDNFQKVIEAIIFNSEGLVPAIAQQHDSAEVLMMAWMNAEAIEKTLSTGEVHYYSRSRKQLWRKGESSGQSQKLKGFTIDCDGDTVLMQVEQAGVACHTGRRTCFFKVVESGEIRINQEVIISPGELYNGDS